MHEALLQYIWKNQLISQNIYKACTGESVEIVHPGKQNSDGGPDFTEARIKLNNTLWVGNIEIHVRSSEWHEHHHQNNPAYNNVILHVVYENDKPCFNASGRRIPSISLQIEPRIHENYTALIQNNSVIRCSNVLPGVDKQLIYFWLNTLSVERLEEKTHAITSLYRATKNSWEEAFYIHLARSFGLKVNTLPFELLAKSLPLSVVAKHADNLLQLEALFFGQSGLLPTNSTDEYTAGLTAEYNFLRKKYLLTPIAPELWKFLRMRPGNFPSLRIAQFTALIHRSTKLFSRSMHASTLDELLDLFDCRVSEYWKNRYNFSQTVQKGATGQLGKSSRILLILNTVIPFMFAFGSHTNNDTCRETAVCLLEEIPAESNRKVNDWKKLGIACRHAADSQALLQLTNCYCEPVNCLKCSIGHQFITNN